jgi:hypothetical protein
MCALPARPVAALGRRGRPARRVALALLLPLHGGCVALGRSVAHGADRVPGGLPGSEAALRRALATGRHGEAAALATRVAAGAPEDALLRALYAGTVAYHAEDFAAAATAFATADSIDEARETLRVSREALALVTNDRVRPYVASPTERLFVRYYAMLAAVRRGDRTAAAVEARRLGQLLERAAPGLDAREAPTHAVLREVAGAVFEAAGEWNDAAVSYRNASLLRGAPREAMDSLVVRPPPPDSVRIVEVVEDGFVAHRVDRGLLVGPSLLRGPGWPASRQRATDPGGLARQVLAELDALPGGGLFMPVGGAGPLVLGTGRRGGWLRLSWPVLQPSEATGWGMGGAAGASGAQAVSAGDGVAGLREASAGPDAAGPGSATAVSADVSQAIGADLARQRVAMATRLLARALAKAAIADAVGERHGELAAAAVSLAGAALERADTRSWVLLPATVSVHRATRPRPAATGETGGTGGHVPVEVVTRRSWGWSGQVLASLPRLPSTRAP